MKYAVAAFTLLMCTAANGQVRSVSNPSALKMDKPRPEQSTATANVSATPKPAIESAQPVPASPPTVPTAQESAELAPTTTTDGALNLICGGGGTANKPNIATVHGSSSASGSVGTTPITMSGSHSGSIVTQRQQDYADQVDVRLFSGDDRIRLPRTLLPPIRGGKDGWFELTNVKVTDRTITASAGINFMNHPKVHIDRLTGTISINGKAGSYIGQCEAVDPNAVRKFYSARQDGNGAAARERAWKLFRSFASFGGMTATQ